MKRAAIGMLALCLAMPALRADSIDEAEAKRRGVSVAQVQAENALAKEKVKTAALEKQLADLQKKLAELQGGGAPVAGTAPAGGMAPTAPSGGITASEGLNFDGPREPNAMYDGFVSRYMSGDWEKLAADMEAAKKDIGAMPAGNTADLTYITRALAECRPIWWDQVKQGKTKQFRQLVWKQPVLVNYQAQPAVRVLSLATVNGEFTTTVSWPTDHMDSHDPISLQEAGLSISGDFGMQKADGLSTGIWQVLGGASILAQVGLDKARALPAQEKTQLDRYTSFWQNVTAGYYGTPAARRLICIKSLASFEPAMNSRLDWVGRRPLGSSLLIELAVNKKAYKGLEVQTIIGLDKLGGDSGSAEYFLTRPMVMAFLNAKLTFEQDRRLREMIKTLAISNAKWTESKLALPADQSYDLDPAKDTALVAARMKAVNP